jgi:lipopolysaccharide/colanic/teichoic acid biosynthesis glycosyltransferase
MKRVIDLIFSVVGLLIFAFPMLIIAICIKIFTPGPILFTQKRVGKGGIIFNLYKFRTMSEIIGKNTGTFDVGDSSRVTKLGSLLRRSKLDELPQLLNVLKGEMSLVGPRPEVEMWTKIYEEKWQIVHSVKPGITDNASIKFRNEELLLKNSLNPKETYLKEILPQKLDLYINYVKNQNISGDIIIIFQTINSVLFK